MYINRIADNVCMIIAYTVNNTGNASIIITANTVKETDLTSMITAYADNNTEHIVSIITANTVNNTDIASI